MLVLSRKIGERILLPHCELALTVIAVEGNAVRLGISAPEDIACTGRNSAGTLSGNARSASEGIEVGGERDYGTERLSWLAVTGSRSSPVRQRAGSNAILHLTHGTTTHERQL